MIIIQSTDDRSMPHHFDCASALYGAIDSAQNYRLTSFSEIESGKLDSLLKLNVCVGSVEFMQQVFKQLNKDVPRLPNANRDFEIITLGEAKERVKSGKKFFIKSVQLKLFTGFVIDGSVYSCIADLPDSTPVMVYEPFDSELITEWRVYVYRNRIHDIKNYSGDFCKIPSVDYITKVIEGNKDFPVAYTADFGVLESGETVLVEYNDMYAIGNYGVPNHIYLFLLRERYKEIMKM